VEGGGHVPPLSPRLLYLGLISTLDKDLLADV